MSIFPFLFSKEGSDITLILLRKFQLFSSFESWRLFDVIYTNLYSLSDDFTGAYPRSYPLFKMDNAKIVNMHTSCSITIFY
jgi:hypothetical protein